MFILSPHVSPQHREETDLKEEQAGLSIVPLQMLSFQPFGKELTQHLPAVSIFWNSEHSNPVISLGRVTGSQVEPSKFIFYLTKF